MVSCVSARGSIVTNSIERIIELIMINDNSYIQNNTKLSKKVALIHQDKIQHYRVAIYNYLYRYLMGHNFHLEVISSGIENGNPHEVQFSYTKIALNYSALKNEFNKIKPDAVIYFVNLRHLYLFPLLFYEKLRGVKILYWGHGINLQNKKSIFNFAYHFLHMISDAIILYAPHLKEFVKRHYHHKIFIAYNTLNMTIYDDLSSFNRNEVLTHYNIKTSRNIVCIGRMEERKRILDLYEAYKQLNIDDVGLVIVGPDLDGVFEKIVGKQIYRISPTYGVEAINLLKACDVYCLPGHVGLGIVDAFYCGLPIVTEAVDHAPEIFYLRNGVNGFMVPKGDIDALSKKLMLLLNDSKLRQLFSENAIETIRKEGHINRMCEGFVNALQFVFQDDFRTNCKK